MKKISLAEAIEGIEDTRREKSVIWKGAKIHRIDITKDLETPSNEYSLEVIRLAKLALHKTGYHLWIPSQEEIKKTGWEESDSAMFYNHNQEVSSKIYNKLSDLKIQEYDITNINGLLRFELTLKRNFLIDHRLINSEETSFTALYELFSIILDNAEALIQTHIAGPMWSGNFLSKRLQKKYIKRYCKTHEVKSPSSFCPVT